MKSILLATALTTVFATAALADETIQTGHFRTVELRGGGHVTLHNGGDQRVVLQKGSTQHTSFRIEDGDKLVIDACNNSCPSGNYDLQIDIATPSISGVAISGGGEIDGSADLSAPHLSAAVEGGGRIDMRAVHADTANAAVNGGGRINLSVASRLNAAVNGGGLIQYWGNPKTSTAISGGGDVRQGN